MTKWEPNPCRKCKTIENLKVIKFLGTMCKIKCQKCGTATTWEDSIEKAENVWNWMMYKGLC